MPTNPSHPSRPGSKFQRLVSIMPLVLLLAWVPGQPQIAHGQSSRPQKFDPLTAEERELAIQLAEADPQVKRLRGGGRQILASVELATPKTDKDDNYTRHAEVLYYRYEGNRGILALVDLQGRRIAQSAQIAGDAVPLTTQEVNQAVGIALQNRTLTNLLGSDYERYRASAQNLAPGQPNQVEALRLLSSSPRDPCYQHRCLSLLFRQGDSFLTGTSVIVDLTAQNVRVEQLGQKRAPTRRRTR